MQTLIIGASGKIGKFLINKKNKNYYYTYHKTKIKNGIKFDIIKNNINKIIEKYNIENVVLLSAITDPDECNINKKKSNLINVTKTKEVIKNLIKKKIYIIFFSSEFIFSGRQSFYDELSRPHPINLYGKQKLEIERFIKKKCTHYAIIRVAKTYTDDLKDNTLVSAFLKKLKKKEILYASSKQIFSPLFVKDLVKIVIYFVKNRIQGTYNVGGPYPQSRKDVLEIIIHQINKKVNKKIKPKIVDIKLENLNLSDKRPLNVSFNVNKIQKLINFKLTKIENVIKQILRK
jgi:dTDP-4-dehydrorhamnose reductase